MYLTYRLYMNNISIEKTIKNFTLVSTKLITYFCSPGHKENGLYFERNP